MNKEKSSPNIMRRNHTFLDGLYLTTNAIKDAYLLLDGCPCIYKKIEIIEKNHDYLSALFDNYGHHRISATDANINNIEQDRNSSIKNQIKKISNYDKTGLLLLSSVPIAKITGVDYEMLLKEIKKDSKKPMINIEYTKMDYDWLDSYSETLKKIAEDMDLGKDKKVMNSVGIVGYFFDRNEGDNTGNLLEIERLFKELSINIESVWLNGKNYEDLKKIEKANLIISLPYAREAAKIIAEKTGARIIELSLPIGIENSINWIRKIAKELKKEKEAEIFIEKDLSQTIPLIGWIVEHFFRGKKVSIVCDPYLADDLITALKEIDVKLIEAVIYSRKSRKNQLKNINLPKKVYFELDETTQMKKVDFVIGNSSGYKLFEKTKYVDFGFPCYRNHFIYNSPYMGIRGFGLLLNRIINSLKNQTGHEDSCLEID